MKTSPFPIAGDLRFLSTSSSRVVVFDVIGCGAVNEI